jgi:hypothetical protein
VRDGYCRSLGSFFGTPDGVWDLLDMHIDVSPQASITLDPRDPCFVSTPLVAKRGIRDLGISRSTIPRICDLVKKGAENQIQLSPDLRPLAGFISRSLPFPWCIYSSHPTSSPTLLMQLRVPGYCRDPPHRFVFSSSAAPTAPPGPALPASLVSHRFHLDRSVPNASQ